MVKLQTQYVIGKTIKPMFKLKHSVQHAHQRVFVPYGVAVLLLLSSTTATAAAATDVPDRLDVQICFRLLFVLWLLLLCPSSFSISHPQCHLPQESWCSCLFVTLGCHCSLTEPNPFFHKTSSTALADS
jgi:hypothetical protein